jgi:hypothetical protein
VLIVLSSTVFTESVMPTHTSGQAVVKALASDVRRSERDTKIILHLVPRLMVVGNSFHHPHTYVKHYSVTGLDRRLGLREVEALRISRQPAHEGVKVVGPTHRPALPARRYPWYSFKLEAESI